MNSKKLRTRGTPSTEDEQGEICCVERFPGATWALPEVFTLISHLFWKICGRQERCVWKKVWETSNVMPHLGTYASILIEKDIPMLLESQRKKDLRVRSHVKYKKLTSKAYPFPNDVKKIRHQECILAEKDTLTLTFPPFVFGISPRHQTNRPFLSAPQAEAIVCRLYQEVDGEEKGCRHFRSGSSVRLRWCRWILMALKHSCFPVFFQPFFFRVVKNHPGGGYLSKIFLGIFTHTFTWGKWSNLTMCFLKQVPSFSNFQPPRKKERSFAESWNGKIPVWLCWALWAVALFHGADVSLRLTGGWLSFREQFLLISNKS